MHDVQLAVLSAELGSQLGAYALTLYILGLCVLPVAAYLITRRWRQRQSATTPSLAMWKIAALMMTMGILVFGVIATLMHTGQLTAFDQAIVAAAVASTPSMLLHFFAIITHLGDSITYTIICMVVALLMLLYKRYALAATVVIAIGGNSILNPALKSLFERVRPLHEDGLVIANGWSFPSGHTSGAVVTYGILTYLLLKLLPARWHPLCVAAGVAIAFNIGCSRVFVQVHYLSDVLAGFMSGTVWLTVCIVLSEYFRRRAVTRQTIFMATNHDR